DGATSMSALEFELDAKNSSVPTLDKEEERKKREERRRKSELAGSGRGRRVTVADREEGKEEEDLQL
ncbi:Hypothetical predicted protein, partial [Olea europaea subsp. europaea]